MSSDILDPIADYLAATVIPSIATSDGTTVKAHKWSPGGAGLDSRPAAVVSIPSVERTPVDEAEDHISQRDWNLDYEVVLYFDATTDPAYSQAQAVEVVELFIRAIDDDEDLGGNCQEAKVTRAEPANVVDDQSQAMFAYVCRVGVLKFYP